MGDMNVRNIKKKRRKKKNGNKKITNPAEPEEAAICRPHHLPSPYNNTSGTSCTGPLKAGVATEGMRVKVGPHLCSGRGHEVGQVCAELLSCPPFTVLNFSCSS